MQTQSNKGFNDLEFEVVQEPWNKYILTDFGVKIRAKFVVNRILIKDLGEGFDFRFNKNVISEAYDFSDHLYSEPTDMIPPNELQNHIVKNDIDFKTLEEDWNIYEFHVTKGIFQLRIKNTMVAVHQTDIVKPTGEPIYFINFSEQTIVKPKS